MATLITGGSGHIGAELARQLVARGEEVVIFDIALHEFRLADILGKVKTVRGDVGNFSQVLETVKANRIDQIYHLGAMLTGNTEQNPWPSMQSNVSGTFHILEAARLFEIKKVLFISSIGSYGATEPPEVITDVTLQRPITLYGAQKLFGEGLGRWYKTTFGLDFRCLRYPQMLAPNVRTPRHWSPPMIEDTILGRPHQSDTGSQGRVIMMYLDDCARSARMIMDAPKENIRTLAYNITGIQQPVWSPELKAILEARYPKADIRLNENDKSARPPNQSFDDSAARAEWGWKPEYDSIDRILDKFEADMRDHPKRFGL